MRRSSMILVALGVLLLAAAATTRFGLVPAATKLPGSTDVTARFAGTATLLDPAALHSGDLAHALAKDVPVTADRRFRVSSTAGDVAIGNDAFTLKGPGGLEVTSSHSYALDRTSLGAAPAPKGADVEEHEGLTVAFPLHPKPSDSYRYYEPSTGLTVPVAYVRTGTVEGRDVYRYTTTATGPLADTELLAKLPPALPKSLAAELGTLLPADVAAQLAPILPTLPDTIPLTYTASTDVEMAADTVTGMPISAHLVQSVVANVELGGRKIALLPVLAVDVTSTKASQSELADHSGAAAAKLWLLSAVVPGALCVVGLLLVALGLRRRKPTPPPQPAKRAAAAGAI